MRVRISPRTPNRLVAQFGRGDALRPRPVSVRIRPSLPCAPVVQPVEAAASKAVQCWFKSGRAHQYVPVADGEASGFQTRDWVFESPPGRQAPQQQMASGRAANSACAVRIRGGAPCGGVDELRKSPVLKTGVSLQGPPRVEFPPPPPIRRISDVGFQISDVSANLCSRHGQNPASRRRLEH